MRFWRKRWLYRWTAVAFSAAAFAPAAQATPLLDESMRGGPQPAVQQTPAPAPSASDDFSWADAGVGAAGALSIVLLVGGSVLVIRGGRGTGLAEA